MSQGFFAYHANHLEDLREIVVQVCKTAPLPPLVNDTFLVQSNGIAQWLKLALAKDESKGGLGIAASLEFSLPASFIWRAYRGVLSSERVPETSPLDKNSLAWRLYRLLPELSKQPNAEDYQSLIRFLEGDRQDTRRYQLAHRLADLFDQYQVYRADWLANWEKGENTITGMKGEARLLEEQVWQARLWRLILEDVGLALANTSRSSVHQQFMEHASKNLLPASPELLPKRIFVFGVTSLPRQTLEALHVVSKFSQVVFCVVNPCQYYWADIVSDRELLLAQHKRGRLNSRLSEVDIDNIHQHANPLLASLGKQGRDYIRLLDEFDSTDQSKSLAFAGTSQIDIYREYGSSDGGCQLLRTIQNDIFDLRPIQEMLSENRCLPLQDDYSLELHQAYSEQREVEVLHDQLLHAFEQDPNLKPSDIIVMMPDINTYAPYIRAVFGLHDYSDKRKIPFTISDQGMRQQAPMLIALESLLSLDTARFTYSEVIALLDVPCLHENFGLNEADVDLLKNWIQGANIRWGLSPQSRKTLLNGQLVSGNTWLDGLKSMFLAYAMSDEKEWSGTQAFGEIGGLQASLIGPLLDFIDSLYDLEHALHKDKTLRSWQGLVNNILDTFFKDVDPSIQAVKKNVLTQVESLNKHVELANASEQLIPLSAFKDSLLSSLENSTVNHKFMIGKVNFATLMPMRAIPFKRVYLLGMNSGDYPRSKINADFDLMAKDYRPGDRSMRDDDRYLFLEAMLSAREFLYISWIGRSIKDDSQRPPSVLVAQVQDYIHKYWQSEPQMADESGISCVDLISTLHPLQAFSEAYFHRAEPKIFTYAKEWQVSLESLPGKSPVKVDSAISLAKCCLQHAITCRDLSVFFKEPIRYFYNTTLSVYFEGVEQHNFDDERFELDRLNESIMLSELINTLILDENYVGDISHRLEQSLQKIVKSGALGLENTPLSIVNDLSQSLTDVFERYSVLRKRYPNKINEHHSIAAKYMIDEKHEIEFEDTLDSFYTSDTGELVRICIASSKTSNSSQGKKFEPRYENLIQFYIEHLLAHSQKKQFTTYVIGREHTNIFKFAPITDFDDTKAPLLTTLIKAFTDGLCRILPVDARVSFAYLSAKAKQKDEPLSEAQATLEKIIEYDRGYLRAAINDIGLLVTHPEFVSLSESIYSHIYQDIEQAVLDGESLEAQVIHEPT